MDLIMLILLNIIHCFMLAKLSRHLYMNDTYVYGCTICCEGALMWQCLVGLIVRIFDLTLAHDIYVLIAVPVAFFLLKSFTNRRTNELIYTSKVEYLPDQSAMEQYVSIMCRVFHGQARCENYIVLQGVFASHIRSCSAPGCPCEDISRALDPAGGDENLSASTSVMKSVRAISIKQTIQRNLSIHSADIPLTDYNSINKKKFFEFMRSLLERALTTVTKTTRLYIQLAYIHFLYLENKFIALYDLMNAQDSKPSFFEEFLIFRLKYSHGKTRYRRNRIEDELKSEEERYARVGNLTLHINQQITFQQNFADFQSKMSKSLEFYIGFWKELMEETPSTNITTREPE
ncbi:MAG: hypothetical protein P4M11_02265 [Candidatus Pacebacteria bacterium]|nr:hypothetical protein [Candidatus Paceibacterota bacterium]